MGDQDVERLSRRLSMTTCMHPKLHNSPAALGVVSLDRASGLFLAHGTQGGQWLLEGRTWDDPPPEFVHQWHLLAAEAAHELDPTVVLPERRQAHMPAGPTRPVGRAQNKRLARFARRHMGLE